MTQSQSNPLLDVLFSRNQILASQAEVMVSKSGEFLQYTVSTFPSGTDHTQRHTQAVESIGRMLLTDELLSTLTDDEIWFLILACHFHDLGMAGTDFDDATLESREQVRRDHSLRVGQIISERWEKLGFPDIRSAEVLGEICRGHRPARDASGFAKWDDIREFEILALGKSVRTRLLSAMIYAFDELHLGADRAPAELEQWRGITNEESKRHWHRHRSIVGPDLQKGKLVFQVAPQTPGAEADIRQVLRKALLAVESLRKQLGADQMGAQVRDIVIDWNRQKQWDLLVIQLMSDNRGRRKDEVISEVLDLQASESGNQVGISDLCEERGCDLERQGQVTRIIDDAILESHFSTVPEMIDHFKLSDTSKHAMHFFERAREADAVDQLLVGRSQARWEQRLFSSDYGRAYVRTVIFPIVDDLYSVRLNLRPVDDPVRLLLESCPTSARLASTHAPPADNLVKYPLLQQIALAGALIDLYADSNRLLDPAIRKSIYHIIQGNKELRSTVRLLEELALIWPLSYQDVSQALVASKAAQEALKEPNAGNVPSTTITVTQSQPKFAKTHTIPHLLYAARRADVEISIMPAKDHELNVEVHGAELRRRGMNPMMLTMGRATGGLTGGVNVPATLEVDTCGRTLRFRIGRFAKDAPTKHPITLFLPAPSGEGERSGGSMSCRIQLPELHVRDLITFGLASKVTVDGPYRVELLDSDSGIAIASASVAGGSAFFSFADRQPGFAELLQGLDPALPAPVLAGDTFLDSLGGLADSERLSKWSQLREKPENQLQRRTCVYSRITVADGVAIDERFLGFFPFDLVGPPEIEDSEAITQVEFKERWLRAEEDFALTSFFEDDVYTLAKALSDWANDGSTPFPFGITNGTARSPTTRSVLTMRVLRKRNQIWHFDRPVIFEFRPISDKERYKIEASYWRSLGDDARALLAEEIGARES